MTTELETDADIPEKTNIEITVYEDANGDGDANHVESLTIDHGFNTYSLNFIQDDGVEYWIRVDKTTDDPEIKPILYSATIETDVEDDSNIISWKIQNDWKSSPIQEGVVFEDVEYTDHNDADTVKRGYSVEDPNPENPFIYFPLHEDSGEIAYDFSGEERNAMAEGDVSPGQEGLVGTTSYSFTNTSSITSPRYEPIDADGGEVNIVTIDGYEFVEHKFTGNEDYFFTVHNLGTSDGFIWYQIVADGTSGTDRDGNDAGLDVLEGEVLRHVDPFLDDNTIFEYTSKENASSLGFTTDTEGSPVDNTVKSESEVNGSCVTEVTWQEGFDLHCQSDARMPTFEEYINDATQGSGCGHDNHLNWSSRKYLDNEEKHWRCPGRVDGDYGPEYNDPVDNSNTHSLRNIADVDLNRPDPVILQDDLALDLAQTYNYPINIVDGPQVDAGITYDLTLGSGADDAIPHTGKQEPDAVSGIENNGTVIIRYPNEGIL